MKKGQSKVEEPSPIKQTADESLSTEPPINHHTNKKHAHLFILGYLTLVLFAAIAGTIGYNHYQHQSHKKTVVKSYTVIQKSIPTTPKPVTGVIPSYQIFNNPKTLGSLNFFSNTDFLLGTNCAGTLMAGCPSSDQILYTQIGITPSKQPIVAVYDYTAEQDSFFFVAIETSTNQYELLSKLNDDANLNPFLPADKQAVASLEQNLNANVTLDTTDTISALAFPQTIVVNGEGLSLPNSSWGQNGYYISSLSGIRGVESGAVPTSAITKLNSSGDITYYEVTTASQASYSVKEIYGVIGGVYAAFYQQLDPLIVGASVGGLPGVQFTDGTLNNNAYTSSAFGCGTLGGYVVEAGIDPGQLTYVGSGPNGENIYELPDSSALLAYYFNGSDSNVSSIAQLQAEHGVIVAQNGLGEYEVFERTDMFEFGGCGKPVIYLYPQKTTDVGIRIGAHITVSDPTYTNNGWQNILAKPNGDLIYDGSSFKSLYWEGTGDGTYPLITSGTVVPRSQAISTILQQLAEQGIDKEESSAFISYWAPKLPNTPYIRLSWLNTSQMDELAPLDISPKPQTVIRVFLDFRGLDQPLKITPQKFVAPQRKGFTVVEWGGLLK